MGYWSDVLGYNVADPLLYVNLAVIVWAPPVPTDWQDNAADASSLSINPPAPARVVAKDIAWYVNTNDMGDQGVTIPIKGGGWSFYRHQAGQRGAGPDQLPDIPRVPAGHRHPARQSGLQHRPRLGVDIVGEINAGRPVLGEFDHFNVVPTGGSLGSIMEYTWVTPAAPIPDQAKYGTRPMVWGT